MAEGSKPTASDPEEVLSYWFPEEDLLTADAEALRRQVRWWMRGGPEVDGQIVERFGHVLEQARRGELDHWAETPRGRLAMIVWCWTSSPATPTGALPSPAPRTSRPSDSPWRA